ncbi:ABC transporter substrate-binding protein [Pantoea sp. Cy-639]|uniref:ABC transporter substrate-binding protein n=1 Tax=Pantoea sp. Cy-639 TaxID=2608360 RepID=UPI00142415DE|nr:ABC transporter substrate-binding protein [Pantoea sp. Cy-639]NIF16445.1 ABC transporter substrate-binding protein [Pantoea sp. Cy-639]
MSRVSSLRPVGIVGPLSGARAAYGQWLRRAAEGTTLPLLWADDGADPAMAQAAARYLLDAGVEVVVGHFNSECARVAGRLYQAAGVPLLLPAATAPDLCHAVGAWRLCASETRQVAVMLEYLARHAGRVEQPWAQPGAYGERLAGALGEGLGQRAASSAGPVVQALMGSHVAVAREIHRRAQPGAVYLVPDDCLIDEFDSLLAGSGVVTLCPHATPDFGECVGLALGLVEAARAGGHDLAGYLEAHPDFDQRQYRHADYRMVRREYPIELPQPL